MEKSDFNLKEIMLQKKGEKKMTYNELYKIISKPWINTKEIQKICQCGQKRAAVIRKVVENEVNSLGKCLPNTAIKCVPTPLLLKYINISESYVYDMAKKEKNLDGDDIK